MFGFGKNKDSNKIRRYLILNIRSSSISASVLKVKDKNSLPNIEYSYTKQANEDIDISNISNYKKEMEALLKEVLEFVIKDAPKNIDPENPKDHVKYEYIKVCYGAPWYKIVNKDVVIKQDKPFVLSKKKFDSILEEQASLKTNTKKGQRVIDQTITNVRLNGYELEDPFNKSTNNLKISFYVSFINESTIKEIENLIHNQFSSIKINHSTYPLIYYSSLKNTLLDINSFTFFDITGLITEIGTVINGSLSYVASVPFGKKDFVDNLSSKLNKSKELVESTLSMNESKQLEDSKNKETEDALEKIKIKWLKEVGKVLSDKKEELPHTIFVGTDSNLTKTYKSILNSKESKDNLFKTDHYLNIVTLNDQILKKHIEISRGVKVNMSDIILTSIFLTHSHQSDM